ncbi:MAG TPA: hypothetical protein VN862_01010 [Candidatus Acidoferrales bacterium]|nr:hypothetical protein [Candidatus Acidoferrales bacterium]
MWLAIVLFAAPFVHAQDLSQYRDFKFRTTVADLSKQTGATPSDVTLVHESPAVMQELTWQPPTRTDPSSMEPVQSIRFSFYNGELYRMVVTYDSAATEGLTDRDIIEAISIKCGTPARFAGQSNSSINDSDNMAVKVVARWEDAQYSFNLFKSSLSGNYGLVMYAKKVNALAAVSAAKSVELERQAAPQLEAVRVKKEAADLEATREKNKKAFQPW